MKQNAIIRICIYSLVLILLLGLLMAGLNGIVTEERWVDADSSQVVHAPQRLDGSTELTVFSPDEVHSLDIDWAAGDVSIRRDDSDTIRIHEQAVGNAKPMDVTLKDGTLNIDFTQHKRNWFGFSGSPTKNLTIVVPRKWDCRELDLDVASSRVTVEDLTIGELDFDGADGNLDLKNCKIQDLDMDCASGEVLFSGELATLDMDGASARFQGTFKNQPSQLTIDGMSGELDVTLPKDIGFTARVEGMSCKFNCDQPIQSKDGAYIYGDGRCKIEADGMSMNVTVRFAE